jgi:hypothetical protein
MSRIVSPIVENAPEKRQKDACKIIIGIDNKRGNVPNLFS